MLYIEFRPHSHFFRISSVPGILGIVFRLWDTIEILIDKLWALHPSKNWYSLHSSTFQAMSGIMLYRLFASLALFWIFVHPWDSGRSLSILGSFWDTNRQVVSGPEPKQENDICDPSPLSWNILYRLLASLALFWIFVPSIDSGPSLSIIGYYGDIER